MDAHVTADITEQWVRVALRRGTSFDPHAIAQMVPDCGYKLRRIEFQAQGELRDQPTSAGEPAQQLVVSGSGQRFALAGQVPERRGSVWLAGRFEPPVGKRPELVVDRVEPR